MLFAHWYPLTFTLLFSPLSDVYPTKFYDRHIKLYSLTHTKSSKVSRINVFSPFQVVYVLTYYRAEQVHQQAEPFHCFPSQRFVVHPTSHSVVLHNLFVPVAFNIIVLSLHNELLLPVESRPEEAHSRESDEQQ